ncbi:hypothetical protein ACFS07_12100 [Undibacterium arcticum]
MLTGLWTYTAGRDEALLLANLRLTRDSGGECHNIMLFHDHADGHALSDAEVVAFYRLAYEEAVRLGIDITFEVHIYMWSEDLRRVLPVAQQVRAAGMPFNFLLDHSHVLIKLEKSRRTGSLRNPGRCRSRTVDSRSIRVRQHRGCVDCREHDTVARGASGRTQRPPATPGRNIRTGDPGAPASTRSCGRAQASGIPTGLPTSSSPARKWYERSCARICKNQNSRLRYLTTEIIDLPDYGDGARYSLFEHSVALALWIRETEAQLRADLAASLPAESLAA